MGYANAVKDSEHLKIHIYFPMTNKGHLLHYEDIDFRRQLSCTEASARYCDQVTITGGFY